LGRRFWDRRGVFERGTGRKTVPIEDLIGRYEVILAPGIEKREKSRKLIVENRDNLQK
jgi:hypothetical protein